MVTKIGDILKDIKPADEKPAPHKLAATINLIKEAGLFAPKYEYTYWLGKVKRAGVTYEEMFGILKEIKNMADKYNKGGRLTNILTARAKTKNEAKAKTN